MKEPIMIEVGQIYKVKNGLMYEIIFISYEIKYLTVRIGKSDLTLDYSFELFYESIASNDIVLV